MLVKRFFSFLAGVILALSSFAARAQMISAANATALPGSPGSSWYNILRGTPSSSAVAVGSNDFSRSFGGTDQNSSYSVVVRMPSTAGQVTVDLSTYLQTDDGVMNFNLINCALSLHSHSPNLYKTLNPCLPSTKATSALAYIKSIGISPNLPLNLVLAYPVSGASITTPIVPSISLPISLPPGSAAVAHILVSNQSDLVITGGDALITFPEGDVTGILVQSAQGLVTERIQINSLQIVHGPPSAYGGQVIAYKPQGSLNAVQAIQLNQTLDPRWQDTNGKVGLKEIFQANLNSQSTRFASAGGKGSTANPTDLLNVYPGPTAGTTILSFVDQQSLSASNFKQFLKLNDSVVVFGGRGHSPFLATGTATNDISLVSVSVYNSPDDAFIFFATGRGILLDKCALTFQNSSQVATAAGAAVRTSGSYGDIVIENSLFEGNGDDVIALASLSYGITGSVTFDIPSQTLTVPNAVTPFLPNENIVLYDGTSNQLAPIATFQTISVAGSLSAKFTYGQTPTFLQGHNYVLFSLDRSNTRSFIALNTIQNSTGDGFNGTMSNGTFTKNNFVNLMARGIRLITLGYNGQNPGGTVSYNDAITNNIFRAVALGYGQSTVGTYNQMGAITLQGASVGQKTETNFPQFSNIVIWDNIMSNIGWYGLYGNLVNSLNARGNTFDSCRSTFANSTCVDAIRIDSGVGTSNNLSGWNTFLNSAASQIMQN